LKRMDLFSPYEKRTWIMQLMNNGHKLGTCSRREFVEGVYRIGDKAEVESRTKSRE